MVSVENELIGAQKEVVSIAIGFTESSNGTSHCCNTVGLNWNWNLIDRCVIGLYYGWNGIDSCGIGLYIDYIMVEIEFISNAIGFFGQERQGFGSRYILSWPWV